LFQALDHALLNWASDIHKNYTSHRNLELYFQQLLETAINKSLFYSRSYALLRSSQILDSVKPIYDNLSKSLNANSLYICARFSATQGIIYMEAQGYVESIDYFVEAVRLLSEEFKLRLSKLLVAKRKDWDPQIKYKICRCVFSMEKYVKKIDIKNY